MVTAWRCHRTMYEGRAWPRSSGPPYIVLPYLRKTPPTEGSCVTPSDCHLLPSWSIISCAYVNHDIGARGHETLHTTGRGEMVSTRFCVEYVVRRGGSTSLETDYNQTADFCTTNRGFHKQTQSKSRLPLGYVKHVGRHCKHKLFLPWPR
jgi:hypothetical protein